MPIYEESLQYVLYVAGQRLFLKVTANAVNEQINEINHFLKKSRKITTY